MTKHLRLDKANVRGHLYPLEWVKSSWISGSIKLSGSRRAWGSSESSKKPLFTETRKPLWVSGLVNPYRTSWRAWEDMVKANHTDHMPMSMRCSCFVIFPQHFARVRPVGDTRHGHSHSAISHIVPTQPPHSCSNMGPRRWYFPLS